jgi:VanZ family protein
MVLRLWWLPVAAIFLLSVVPPSLRPVLGPHVVEHAVAFGIAGIWFAAAKRQPLWMLLAAAVAFACAIEFLQLFVHGRHARLRDLVVDLLAAGAGTVIGYLIRQRALSAPNGTD